MKYRSETIAIVWIFLSLLYTNLCAEATTVAPRNTTLVPWDIPGEEGSMRFGMGIDTLKGELVENRKSAIKDADRINGTFSSPGTLVSDPVCYFDKKVEFKLVDSEKDVTTSLGAGMYAKIDGGIGSISGGVDVVINFMKKDRYIHVFFQDMRKNCDYKIASPELTTDAMDFYIGKENSPAPIATPTPPIYRFPWSKPLQRTFSAFNRSNSFSTNVSTDKSFRETYGDAFCNMITTGGRFWGVLHAKVKTDVDIYKFKAKVKAKAFGQTIFSISISETVKNILAEDEIDPDESYLNVYYNNSSFEEKLTGKGKDLDKIIERFGNYYGDYLSEVLSESCTGHPWGFRDCGFKLYSFEPYSAIAKKEQKCDSNECGKDQLHKLNALARRYVLMEDLTEMATAMQEYPEIYEKETVEAFLTKTDAILQKTAINYSDCADNSPLCAIGDNSPYENIENSYPKRKKSYPKNCKELQVINNVTNDGEYTLYFEADKNKPFSVYCENMYDRTKDPDMYLILKKTSAATRYPSYNYFRYANVPAASNDSRTDLVSVYKMLKINSIDEKSQTVIIVSQDQPAGIHAGNAVYFNGMERHEIPFGHGVVCDSLMEPIANITLEGTPFVIKNLDMTADAPEAETSNECTEDKKSCTFYARIKNGCAQALFSDEIVLQYKP